jgi:hypothetical protein
VAAKTIVIATEGRRTLRLRSRCHIRTMPRYVVDHIVPLKRGGVVETSNMEWQTTAEAKDRIE